MLRANSEVEENIESEVKLFEKSRHCEKEIESEEIDKLESLPMKRLKSRKLYTCKSST